MRWTAQDLAPFVRGTTPPLRNGVFQTAADYLGPISYRKCINGIWFPPCDTASDAAACERVATDAPAWWRGLRRNFTPVALRMVIEGTPCGPGGAIIRGAFGC